MITVITGLPGNGKTLYGITWLKEKAEKENRPVFYSGITDCMIPGWTEADPEKWMDLPSGSLIVIDEVQRVMRPRQHGTKVPDFIAALETHRHKGVDLVLITQHPMLIDSNVRRLAGQHFHVIRKFGTHMATIHEWNKIKENCDKNREDSIRHEWRFPKETFALYKSAEVHTHKRRVPMKVWVLLTLPFIIGAIAWYTWTRLNAPKGPVRNAFTGETAASAPAGTSRSVNGRPTVQEFLAVNVPRIEGLPHTAPLYDEITKPVEAPYPAACVVSESRGCRCFSQQGTTLVMPDSLCRQVVAGGFFVSWKLPEPKPHPVSPAKQSPQVLAGEGIANGGSVAIGHTRQQEKPSPSILDTDPTRPGRGKALPPPTQNPPIAVAPT